jgi:membrane protein insertase Oxa1/YidC/SpoIIIJ
MMTNFFLVMIIVMGFMLPAAMSVYWIAGSVFAVVQTLLINRYTAKHENKGF